ncbi:DUF2309 domain-containing protein [Botrimarina hoheduenensis]|uniref:Probable inorganic carbon transporter subunit DabA n=1 Tax=Botrimarina hoheduenensis TaxID=2528000 RepID=A0A5C5VQ89_9BACT|nr:DUF2309 domain-containing protein [Botrimarina hoheduenensis]TWT40754.1 hypothetical protein Pla111_31720 [Botrimarina hoheduenensis]
MNHVAGETGLLVELIEHGAHLLPSQGPISVFVHHNTLHAFEDQTFSAGVNAAADLYDCHPYLPEAEYRRAVACDRISSADLEHELFDELNDTGDRLIGHLGTLHYLRMSMLAYELFEGSEEEVRWSIDESDTLKRFRSDAPEASRRTAVEASYRWLVRDYNNGARSHCPLANSIEASVERLGGRSAIATWNEEEREAFCLQTLWDACLLGAQLHSAESRVSVDNPWRCSAADEAIGQQINPILIRFCAAFLDQGQAAATLPDRGRGFLQAFVSLHRNGWHADHWLDSLADRILEIDRDELSPEEVISLALDRMGVAAADQPEYLQRELLALRGWAGLLWQMETNAEWTPCPAPRGTLVEYMAVRLLLRELATSSASVSAVSASASGQDEGAASAPVCRAYVLFQIAQVCGWSGIDLLSLTNDEWATLWTELQRFPSRERRRVFHQAYERHYRDRALNALVQNGRKKGHLSTAKPQQPAYQVVCCIDDREESFRRHLEEVDPECETLGLAGFFGVAMYYRGLGEAFYRPLCPVNVKPKHHIVEEPVYSETEASRRRASARKVIGKAAQSATRGSQSILGGLLAGVLGPLATLPLVLRVVFPRRSGRLANTARRLVGSGRTRLAIEAGASAESPEANGYTVDEMAAIVAAVLRMCGLEGRLSPLVVICGHGSSSVNNPHAAAYDCGACGGGRGGPNARAFARMANDPRVRQAVLALGVAIPESTVFIGAYHNTCDDSVDYYDLDEAPARVTEKIRRARLSIDEARARNAHERSRRFESASLTADTVQALHHVEGRAADLSQVRSECGHATNATCLVGRRDWSRGLFMDRRAFLTSYDPATDNEERTVLAGLLGAVIPVCAGINLEYYFSRVDNRGYGCGTKLPHNVAAMLGVMDGAGSDVRTGLPWQMVEIHEPMRILFVIEAPPKVLLKIMANNAAIDRLVRGSWVQIASIDPDNNELLLFQRGQFEPFVDNGEKLPVATSSLAWYRGQRDHLEFAQIDPSRGTSVGGLL